jgi:hypothetical protein
MRVPMSADVAIIFVETIFARLLVPVTFSEVPKIPVPIRVPVDTFVETRFARLDVPSEFKEPTLRLFDMYTLPSTSNSVSENRAPFIQFKRTWPVPNILSAG